MKPDLRVEVVTVASLQLDPANARRHSPRNVDAIVASLQAFGQRRPLVVHGNVVVAGNGTLEAVKQLGWKQVAVTRCPDDWTPAQARAFAVADNRTAELAEWDGPVLLDALSELEPTLLEASGFTFDELTDLTKVYGPAPGLDDLDSDLDDDDLDGLVRITFKVPADVADKWNAAVVATGQRGMEAYALLVQVAWDALSDGSTP